MYNTITGHIAAISGSGPSSAWASPRSASSACGSLGKGYYMAEIITLAAMFGSAPR